MSIENPRVGGSTDCAAICFDRVARSPQGTNSLKAVWIIPPLDTNFYESLMPFIQIAVNHPRTTWLDSLAQRIMNTFFIVMKNAGIRKMPDRL